jgi:hypothetical protein
MTAPSTQEIVASLRRWTDHHDPHVRGAVELLISNRWWLDNDEFAQTAMQVDDHDNTRWIDWDAARQVLDNHRHLATTQRAILDLAIALATATSSPTWATRPAPTSSAP